MRFRLLGPLRVWDGAAWVPVRAAQQRVVLSVLLLESGRVVSADRLVDEIWGKQPPRAAGSVLRGYVLRLRRLLGGPGPNTVLTRPNGYELVVDPDDVDALVFDRLVAAGREHLARGDAERAAAELSEALALWQGPALADVPRSPTVERHVTGLEQARLAATEDYVDGQLRSGRHAEVIGELEHLVTLHTLRERLWEQLILALHRSGRRADALDAYQRARTVLIGELGLEPGQRLQALHTTVLQDQPATDSTVPAQLPADLAAFVGRADHLRQLDKLLDARGGPRPAAVVACVVGSAGIGKTTLAVHWAHRVADRFPDGQLYVNLRGFDPAGSAMAPAEAVRGFLDSLQVPPQSIPTSLDAQAGLYRSKLANRRMLIVLDNARDAEQVRPLLPGTAGCLVLVTSRSQLLGLVAGHGADTATLDLLPAAEARLVLRHRIGADRLAAAPAATDEIVDRCGGLPLALAIVAARVVTSPDFPLDAVARDLHGSRRDLDGFEGGDATTDLRAVFSWSYDALSAPAARLFRLLALHPGPDLRTSVAASIAGLPARPARQALAELTRAHLITEHVPGRVRFHDLVRAHATELVGSVDSPAEQDAATGRMLDHYLDTAHAADVLLDPHRASMTPAPPGPGVTPEELADRDQALAWFTTEHAVLLAVVGCAARSALDTHAWQLAWAARTYFQRRGHYHDLADTQEVALRAAERLADPALRAQAHRGCAVAGFRLGRLDDCHAHLQHALGLSQELDDPIGMAYAHLAFSPLLEAQGHQYRAALDHARQALALFEAGGDRTGQARALNIIGWQHTHLGEHQRAVTACRQALVLLEEIGDRHGEGMTWDSLGYAYHQLGDYPEAAACYQQALTLLSDAGERLIRAETLSRLGETHHAAGRRDDARAAWRAAMTLYDEVGHPYPPMIKASLKSS